MAQMVNQAAQSEMRIGINTAAFGNVEVRTIVHANDVGVQIGSEKGDLRSLLANELPGIATSLQQQDLRLNQVNFHQTGFAFSNQMSSGGDAQPRSFSCRPRAAATQPADLFRAESTEPSATSSAGGAAGLSILA
jgi:flagellar hook-length control protein FliK